MAWTTSTPVTVGNPTKKTDADKIFDNTLFLAGGIHHNLKLARGATAEILWVYAQSSGVLPSATNPIGVLIPDGDELQIRQRTAAYLSGAGSFTLADAAGYWGRASTAASKFTAYLYAIWDGTGIVWALCAYSGINLVPTTVTAAADNYFLLEDSSTYTRNAAHYCVSIAKLEYEYHTADAPDHTINATGFRFIYDRDPNDIYEKETVYGSLITLSTSGTSAVYIAVDSANARISFVCPRNGSYAVSFIFTASSHGLLNGILNDSKSFCLTADAGTNKYCYQTLCYANMVDATGTHVFGSTMNLSCIFYCIAETTYNFDLYYLEGAAAGNWSGSYVNTWTMSMRKRIEELRQSQ